MTPAWAMLILSLPTQHATARMRIWRALKALGCGVLRDGVYLLPNSAQLRQTLEAQAGEINASGGSAYVLALNALDQEQQETFERLFDRSEDYARLLEVTQQLSRELKAEDVAPLQRRIARLRKDFDQLAALDFFPGEARQQTALALNEFEQALLSRACPDEPHAVERSIPRLRREDHQARTWATRQRPWIDRLASAWLIRRFIDPTARFLWLTQPDECPPDALGFDFDGAVFTHVGGKVTFEVLLTSFGLAGEPALEHLGRLVHVLDVGGIPVVEAPGLAALIRGMQQRFEDDDQLLKEAEKVFDSFYSAFSGNDA
ncbi:hypothetical protein EWI61_04855 [Methylolobus aquaticus]|nr:hypothetical protein EWI61_04855 [Methylolobus aquaticus]